MKVTTHRPDTCGCELRYSWDETVPAENRKHFFESIIPCSIHATVDISTVDTDRPDDILGGKRVEKPKSIDEARYYAAVDDNRMKNLVYAIVVEELSEEMTFETINQETGELERRERVNAYDFFLDADRKLTYSVNIPVAPGKFTAINSRVAGVRIKSASREEFKQVKLART